MIMLFFDRLLQFLRLKSCETAFLKVAVPKLEIFEQAFRNLSFLNNSNMLFPILQGQTALLLSYKRTSYFISMLNLLEEGEREARASPVSCLDLRNH
jgi:hypothetical protein